MSDLAMALVLAIFAAIPIGLTTWGVLDVARRPQWAWALANRSQLAWMAALLFGAFTLLGGMGISIWYLLKVRPIIAAAEQGHFES